MIQKRSDSWQKRGGADISNIRQSNSDENIRWCWRGQTERGEWRKGTSIKGVELGDEVELEKDILKAVLLVDIFDKTGKIELFDDAEEADSKETVTEGKDVSLHQAKISVVSIAVEEGKEKVMPKTKKA